MSPRFVLERENVPCVAEVDNRSLKADCTDFTRNLLKSSMLRPLKGKVGYKLAESKWSKTPAQAPLAFNCQIDLMFFFFLKLIVFCIPPWLTMLLYVDVHRSYTPIYRFHHLISKTRCPRFQQRELMRYLFGMSARAIFKVLKIIIIAELYIVMTISPGQLRQ